VIWADVSEVPIVVTRAILRAYVDEQLDKYADLTLDVVGNPHPPTW
jgi:hypothetical protein